MFIRQKLKYTKLIWNIQVYNLSLFMHHLFSSF